MLHAFSTAYTTSSSVSLLICPAAALVHSQHCQWEGVREERLDEPKEDSSWFSNGVGEAGDPFWWKINWSPTHARSSTNTALNVFQTQQHTYTRNVIRSLLCVEDKVFRLFCRRKSAVHFRVPPPPIQRLTVPQWEWKRILTWPTHAPEENHQHDHHRPH